MPQKLSPQTVSKMIALYFKGNSETQIADLLGIDQTTVAKYKSKFKELAEQFGMAKATEEYGVTGVVEALHSLSVELTNSHLTVAEAKVGLRVQLLLEKYGIDQEEYADCIKALKRMKDEGFIAASIKLSNLEDTTGMSGEEIVAQAASEYQQLLKNKQVNEEAKLELKTAKGKIAVAEQELIGINSQKEAAGQSLKEYLQEIGVDMNRLKTVQPLNQALKKAGIPDEDLGDYVARQQVLNKADMSINLFTEIVEKAKVLTWQDHGKALLTGLSDYANLDSIVKDLQAKVASLKVETGGLDKVAKDKGKLQADVDGLKLEKAIYEGLVAEIPAKREELDQLKKDITSYTKQKAELNQNITGLEPYKNELDADIKEKEHWVADLKQMQTEHDKLAKDSAELGEKMKNDRKRWEIYQSFLGFVQSTSLEEQEQFAKVLPSLLEDVKKGKYSPQLLRRHVLDTLTGSGLQVLTCSCGLHSTVDMPAPSWGYKCPASGASEFSHHIKVDKDASAILNEALSKAKPIPIQISTIHVLKPPQPKEKA